MSTVQAPNRNFTLDGIDGTNPLGFLTALGTLVVLHAAGETDARLRWVRTMTWTPVLEGISSTDASELSRIISAELAGRLVTADADTARRQAQTAFDQARKRAVDKRKEITKRGLRGDARRDALDAEATPLEEARDQRRDDWLAALARAVPSPELALGKRIDPTVDEYRLIAKRLLDEAGEVGRAPLDLLAAFASDACTDRYHRTEATPFCFVTGSGHQFFLDTVRELMGLVDPERVQRTLFEPWTYSDERRSLRWDPIEDNRYALAATDPSDTESRTVWVANLLAYRSLTLFPSAPQFVGLRTTAWRGRSDDPAFTWPIWEVGLGPDTIRSLLLLPEIHSAKPDRAGLRARGVTALFQSRRIKIGSGANFKVNFTPAKAV